MEPTTKTTPATTTTTCPTCGRPVEQTGKGRPRERHDDCRKLEQVLSWTENLLGEIDFRPEHARRVRKTLWNLANAMNRVPHHTTKEG